METAITILNIILIFVVFASITIACQKKTEEEKASVYLVMLFVLILLYIVKDILHECRETFTSKTEARVEKTITIKNGVADTTYIYHLDRF